MRNTQRFNCPPRPPNPPLQTLLLPTPACLQDITNEINEMMGQSFAVPEDVDEADLMAELDALEGDMAAETSTAGGVPSYLQVGGWLLRVLENPSRMMP